MGGPILPEIAGPVLVGECQFRTYNARPGFHTLSEKLSIEAGALGLYATLFCFCELIDDAALRHNLSDPCETICSIIETVLEHRRGASILNASCDLCPFGSSLLCTFAPGSGLSQSNATTFVR